MASCHGSVKILLLLCNTVSRLETCRYQGSWAVELCESRLLRNGCSVMMMKLREIRLFVSRPRHTRLSSDFPALERS